MKIIATHRIIPFINTILATTQYITFTVYSVFCVLVCSAILCPPIHHPTPTEHFIFINVIFCNYLSLKTHVSSPKRKSSSVPCRCREHPRKIMLLIIPILIHYTALCKNVFELQKRTDKKAKRGMLQGIRGHKM